MTDGTQAGGGAGAGRDPWAPPEHRTSLEKQTRQSGASDQPSAQQPTAQQPMGQPTAQPPSVHDQVTMTSMPASGFASPGFGPAGGTPAAGSPQPAVPPPPIAPSGPGAPGPAAPGGYGYPGYGWPGTPMPPQNGMGIAAMVLGIVSCTLFCLYGVISLVTGILAVVFGIKGRRRAERGVATNHGQAQAGLIMGIIGIVLGIAVIVLMVVGITAAINEDNDDPDPYYGAGPGAVVSVLPPR
ncbi:DUF4190 domain-containing protein [Streptomyces deserti]